MTLLQVCCWI